MFDIWYCEQSQHYGGKLGDKYRPQSHPISEIENPHLEITAHGEFSEELKLRKFNYYMFEQLFAEQLQPDILGYVIKSTGKKQSPIETIAVEVKAHELTLRDLMQAKLYETVFGAKHTFLLSPQGMTGEKMEVVLRHGSLLRGNVVIGKCNENGKVLLFDPRLVDYVPKELRQFCNATRYHSDIAFASNLFEASKRSSDSF